MKWSPIQKITFRFVACYFFLFCMSNQFVLSFAFGAVWQKAVPWFAVHILRLEDTIEVFTNGSGDTTYNYVTLLLFVLLSAVATVFWSWADRKRGHYEQALGWLVLLIRYYVIYQMIVYGMAKIFYLQFQPPRFTRLIQPYGDSSPMGLLWTFMGYSKGYTMFTGFGELLGGLLLLHRRTVTLGALIVFGVMANVMALNFFYDVPVKVLSSHLVLLSLFLIALDGRRLWDFFIANRPVESRKITPLFSNPKWERIKNIIKWVVVAGGLGAAVLFMLNMMKKWGPNVNRPVLYGLYEVESFVRNQGDVPPLATDSTRWKRLIVEQKDRATVEMMNGKELTFDFVPDTTAQIITVSPAGDTTRTDTLLFSYPDPKRFILEGVHDQDTVRILMKVLKKEDFLLMNRGFRWINEYPFNR